MLCLTAFAIGLRGILRYGYIGQDYGPHRATILDFPDSFSFHLTDPPGFYWLSNWILRHLSSAYYLELTALAFLILNTSVLWILYRIVWASLGNGVLRWATAALITFLPVRLIHSIVIAADALTIPCFALVVFFTVQLRENPRRRAAWAGLAVSCCLGLLVKYTFAGLLVPLALVLSSTILQRLPHGERRRKFALLLAALALPAAILFYQVKESAKGEGAMTHRQWLPPDAPSVMRWRDMLAPQPSDLALFSAPAYFRDALYEFRIYSYPGLVFISTVTDPLNLFQTPPAEISMNWDRRMQEGFFRGRSDRSQLLQTHATRLSLPFFLLAIVGTVFCGGLGLQALLTRRSHLPDTAVVVAALAAGIYSPIFFGLHRIADPYGEGFWTARLILPSIVFFLILGFILLDQVLRFWVRAKWLRLTFLSVLLGWTTVTCGLFIGFLV